MGMLNEYYHPLNISLVLGAVTIFFFLDVVGWWFDRKILQSPVFLRPVFWIYGLGLFIFYWFLLHFQFTYSPSFIIWSSVPWLIVCLPEYLMKNGWKSLLDFLFLNKLPLFFLSLLIPALFVKSSLPPYLTDEAAYHFISPWEATHGVWDFNQYRFYVNIPKLLDIFFALPFSIFKTYSVSRLLHFIFTFSCIYSITVWIKQRFGFKASAVFVWLYMFLQQDLLIIGTSGYIDYSSGAAIALCIVLILELLIWSNYHIFLVATLLWGMALGMKYVSLIPFISWGILYLLMSIKDGRKTKLLTMITGGILGITFGGYWYIKNWIFTGNPIYPFLFGCKLPVCFKPSGYFDGWTTPITFQSFFDIVTNLLSGHTLLTVLLIVSTVILLLRKGKSAGKVGLFIVSTLLLDFVLMKNVSGFLSRYYFYVQILFLMIIALPFALSNLKIYKVIVILFTFLNMLFTLKTTYWIWNYLSPQEVYYAIGKTNINHWLNDRHGENGELIKWCGTQGEKLLNIIDDGLLYTQDEQTMNIFNVNCRLNIFDFFKDSYLFDQKGTIWFATRSRCQKGVKIADERQNQRNEILCKSVNITKNLYRYDNN